MKIETFLLFISFFFMSSLRANEDIRKILSPEIKGDVLYISGTIDSHIYDFFAYAQKELENVKTVSLNSYGGSHHYAMEIVRKIREHNLNTTLEKDNVCASACIYLYGAGKFRTAHESTWFGIHGARLSKGQSFKLMTTCYFKNESGFHEFDLSLDGCEPVYNKYYELALEETKKGFLTLEEMGTSRLLLQDYLSLEEDPNWQAYFNVLKIRDWTLPAAKALEYNLVNQIF
jgi:hypothetical protein